MAAKNDKLEADIVIIGGGPGGSTAAKELSRKGKKVVLLEKGRDDNRFFGNGLGAVLRMEKEFHFPVPMKQSKQGDAVVLASCLGGGTLLYAGAAARPEREYWNRHGIDLSQEIIDECIEECWVHEPPEEFIGPGTRRISEAANELGIPFEKQLRHVDFTKCKPGCEYCINGCKRGAKWTAREFAHEAVSNGATLLVNTEAQDIIIENGTAVGVRAKGKGKQYDIRAKIVLCAAGGAHTARLLQRSGFTQAGSWFTGDPTFFTFGFAKEEPGNSSEHSMTTGWHDDENKILFCSMLSPKGSWQMQFILDEHIRGLFKMRGYRKALGVFAKVCDDGEGSVTQDGKINKIFTDADHKRFAYSRDINTKILVKAGCDPNDIHHSGFVMGHPGGTVRIGEMLDTNLETSVKNLYVCDTSMFPEAPGIPPAWTIVAMSKRLSHHLEMIL